MSDLEISGPKQKNSVVVDGEVIKVEMLGHLKNLYKELTQKKEIIVNPQFSKLTNLQTMQTPRANKTCPQCNSGKRYSKCCEGADLTARHRVCEQI